MAPSAGDKTSAAFRAGFAVVFNLKGLSSIFLGRAESAPQIFVIARACLANARQQISTEHIDKPATAYGILRHNPREG